MSSQLTDALLLLVLLDVLVLGILSSSPGSGSVPPTVFGIDEVDVKLTGRFNGMMASCSGTAEQAPGVVFEATLFLGQDQSPESDRKRAAVKFDAGKLPKGADSRYNARNPFARGPSRI